MALSDDLLARQDELQAEADEVTAALGLGEALAALGDPIRVGSSALQLMVRRDIDLTVVCPALDEPTHEAVWRIGADLVAQPRVRQVTMRDDTGHWNVDPAYPDGLYLKVEYRTLAAQTWNLDIWFVDDPSRQPDLAHLKTFPERLTDDLRLAILRIKHAWARNPGYGSIISSYDVYRSVLDDGVRTPEQFEEWRKR
ncbi:hypothetical protein [Amycolatopsis sp. NPDC059657]|uniref:hypothetical protein n=1 Tax=Amycolatopsis sp. NPDC059657 TaxID=3346899 RepID=UPI00366EFD35